MPKKKKNQYMIETRMIKEMFQENSENITLDGEEYLRDEMNYSPLLQKKRISASCKYIEKVSKRCSFKYSKMPYMEAYAAVASSLSQGTKGFDYVFHPFLGAAIWILDYFFDREQTADLHNILPFPGKPLYNYNMPEIEDCIHSDAMISAVVTVIMERDGTCKEEFIKIIKMIDDRPIRRLRKLYEDNMFNYIDLCIDYIMYLQKKHDADADSLIDNLKKNAQSDVMSIKGKLHKHLDLEVDLDILEDEMISEQSYFIFHSPTDLNRKYDVLCERYNEKAATLLRQFGKGDPYDICAAYLFMTISDDELLYLITPSAATLFYAACRLPWFSITVPEDTTTYKLLSYDLLYDGLSAPFTECMFNQQHLLYSINNQLMPRGLRIADVGPEYTEHYNVPVDVVSQMYNLSITLDTIKDYSDYRVYDTDEDDDIEEASQADAEQTIESLVKQNSLLARKIKEYQATLNEEKHNQSKLKKQYEESIKQSSIEREELISLREALFHAQRSESEEQPDDTIKFPQKTTGDICVFGGFDAWMKAIKPLLPDVKFYSREINPHPNLIKNADVIWLQTNSMSHNYFEQIINVARKHNKICRYFYFNSAQKCAEQIYNYYFQRKIN